MSSTIDIDKLVDLMFGQPILFDNGPPYVVRLKGLGVLESKYPSVRYATLKSKLMSKSGIKKRRSARSLKRWKKQRAQRRARKITARCGK